MNILLIAYFVFLLGLAVFGSSAVYHARKFGFPGDRTKLGIVLYVAAVAIVLLISFALIGTTDFSPEEI